MRNAFAQEITALAREDERICLLSGDIGNRMYDEFKRALPNRFFNCGVAEANMTGVAAGLAMCGLRPFTYTIAPFATTRCLEQIRVDICYHAAPVVVVGVGAGCSYASLGATHHACEDLAFLRSLPNMTVVCPGDAMEVRQAVRALVSRGKPAYLRLGKKNEPIVHQSAPSFQIGKATVVTEGAEVCLVSTGNVLPIAVAAGEVLNAKGVSASVVSFHTVKPLDEQFLSRAFSTFKAVVTVEEHSLIGGLGGAVAEWLVDHGVMNARLCRAGTPDRFLHGGGDHASLREEVGLTPDSIAAKAIAAMKRVECVSDGDRR